MADQTAAIGEHVRLSTDEHGVGTLRLDRPPVNALNYQVWRELRDAADALTADDAVRAVVLWGGERAFAAGADIKAMAQESHRTFAAISGGLQEALRALARIPKVTIAAVAGYALGGGCELALTADFRFAATDARFGQPEILLGVIPGAGGTQRLPRIIGVQKAKDLVYSGRMVDAEEALAIGLVDQVHPPDQVYDRAVEQARRYARGPFALRYAKQAIDQGFDMDLETALRLETTLFTACFATNDREIGMRSFLEDGPGRATFTGS